MIPLGDVFQSVHQMTMEAAQRAGASQTPTMRNTPDGLRIILGAPEASKAADPPAVLK